MRRNILWIWITLVIIAIDRITKILVLHHLPYAQPVSVYPFFNLFFVYNTGAAFSFLDKFGGWQNWLFSGIALVVSYLIIVKLWYTTTQKNIWFQTALALILGGALGNLYDRIAYRHVVDFIDFYVNNWHWPAFNIADSAISVGAVMLILWSLKQKETR